MSAHAFDTIEVLQLNEVETAESTVSGVQTNNALADFIARQESRLLSLEQEWKDFLEQKRQQISSDNFESVYDPKITQYTIKLGEGQKNVGGGYEAAIREIDAKMTEFADSGADPQDMLKLITLFEKYTEQLNEGLKVNVAGLGVGLHYAISGDVFLMISRWSQSKIDYEAMLTAPPVQQPVPVQPVAEYSETVQGGSGYTAPPMGVQDMAYGTQMQQYQQPYQPQGAQQYQQPYQPQGPQQYQQQYQPQGVQQYQQPYQPQGPQQYQQPYQPQGPQQYQQPYQPQGPQQYQQPYQPQGAQQYQQPYQPQGQQQYQQPYQPQGPQQYQQPYQPQPQQPELQSVQQPVSRKSPQSGQVQQMVPRSAQGQQQYQQPAAPVQQSAPQPVVIPIATARIPKEELEALIEKNNVKLENMREQRKKDLKAEFDKDSREVDVKIRTLKQETEFRRAELSGLNSLHMLKKKQLEEEIAKKTAEIEQLLASKEDMKTAYENDRRNIDKEIDELKSSETKKIEMEGSL